MRSAPLVLALTAALALTGCAAGENNPPPSQKPASETTPKKTPETTPEPELITTFNIGDRIALPSATFAVDLIEQRDVIESEFPDFQPHFVPSEGERLWFLSITWTNTTDTAVGKECHGPDMFDLKAYDINGVEMMMVEQPGHIVGQNCTTGLLKGQTGTWLTGFRGLDADFGWAEFTDYAGGEAYVVLDPDIQLQKQMN